MKPNNTFADIGEQLKQANTVLIVPHEMMDGDAFGSAVALCKSLRILGKTAWILLEDKIPDYLIFLDRGYSTHDQGMIQKPDISLCIDCSDRTRFKERALVFDQGKVTVCLDHHTTSKRTFDYNYVDGNAAATGEIVYDLLTQNKMPMDKEIAEALFVAITTDTGNFQYANTSKRSHEIVIDLYDNGMDFSKVSVAVYQNERFGKFMLECKVLESAQLFASGRGILAYVTQQMLEECDARMEETEGIVSKLRSIQGVEIAVLIKEYPGPTMKVGLRAKNQGDVSVIATKFGGGGHIKAAGFTLHDTMENTKNKVVREVEAQLRDS